MQLCIHDIHLGTELYYHAAFEKILGDFCSLCCDLHSVIVSQHFRCCGELVCYMYICDLPKLFRFIN